MLNTQLQICTLKFKLAPDNLNRCQEFFCLLTVYDILFVILIVSRLIIRYD